MIERTERHLTLMPASTDTAPEQKPVPHDPHAAWTGMSVARTEAEIDDAIQVIRTMVRGSWITSRIRLHHKTNVRVARLSWIAEIKPWQPSDSLRCPVNLRRDTASK
jgi:hypothetical protein